MQAAAVIQAQAYPLVDKPILFLTVSSAFLLPATQMRNPLFSTYFCLQKSVPKKKIESFKRITSWAS